MEVYIDDSLGICPASHAMWLFNSFKELVASLTLRLSSTPGHIAPPSSCCVVLGVLFDTTSNTISLPQGKLEDIKQLLEIWSRKTTATPRDLASLAGKLLWVCRVVIPGRTFLGRVLQLKRTADARPGHLNRRPIVLDQDFKLDIQWWREMVTHWNGRSFLQPMYSCDVALDASSCSGEDGGPGLGCFNYTTGEYISSSVPDFMRLWSIADLELVCHVVCLRAWGHQWRHRQVHVLTDSEPTRHLLQAGRSRNSLRLAIAREIVGIQFTGEFRMYSSRIATGDNHLADALSRLGERGQWERFVQHASGCGSVPSRSHVPMDWFEPYRRWQS